MTEEMKAKRQALKEISAPLLQLVKAGAIETINEGLSNMYAEQGHTELHSYLGWKKKGFQVKKGSKALLMWGEPKPIGKIEDKATATDEEQKEQNFFPLAYVFSNLQVEKIE